MNIRLLCSAFLFLLLPVNVMAAASEGAFVITAEQWAIPRHGERLLKLPVFRELMNKYQQDSSQVVEIRYPGGEQGELWVSELQDWLIALGLPSGNIRVVAGSGGKDMIKLVLYKTRGREE